jgi:hypothetical protein
MGDCLKIWEQALAPLSLEGGAFKLPKRTQCTNYKHDKISKAWRRPHQTCNLFSYITYSGMSHLFEWRLSHSHTDSED